MKNKTKTLFIGGAFACIGSLSGHGETFQQKLDALGYDIDGRVFSPHEFGIPQHRPRFYIVGMLRDTFWK